MRGKLSACTDHARLSGITPAHAGKTSRKDNKKRVTGDHPRACGENVFRKRLNPWRKGSPPRMRGKHARVAAGVNTERITPAHAGKTIGFVLSDFAVQDHPRACGENRLKRGQNPRRRGSPPRMRGKQSIFLHCSALLRITPAHAGKT